MNKNHLAILGVSGLAKSVPFKRAHWPGLDEREYRISQGHDAAAALVVDGKIVAAAAEERFNRRKHSPDFPSSAIAYCLAEAGMSLADVDEIVHSFDHSPYRTIYALDKVSRELYDDVLSRSALLKEVARYCEGYPPERVREVSHHLCHAASAYYTSGWDECLVIVVDAMGETQGASVFVGHDGRLNKVREIPARDSIGILYSLITLHLGFDFNSDEYKIMGLAPYGDPRKYAPILEQAVEFCLDGSIRIPILHLNKSRDERENYEQTRTWLSQNLIPPRRPDAPISQDHRDAAAALQALLDRTMLHICGSFGQITGMNRLALAGGVALNCTANGKLMRSGRFDEIYVQPAAGDDGTALGAALIRSATLGQIKNRRILVPFLGPAHDHQALDDALTKFSERISVARFDSFEQACAHAARLIAEGKVLAWYRGRMEFGPRALGNRSILADPGHPDMRDRINAMVKKREAFRPFAPAVSLEQVDRWFEVAPMTALPYMIAIVDVRNEHRLALPAITHVNGSARVQTVSSRDNPDFHALLRAVGKTTGREMLLNTSFNVKGQPIVNTPREAIETFLGTGIDYLFVENAMVTRR